MASLSASEKLDYLRLIRSENVGPVTFYNLLKYFGSAKEALANIQDFAKKGGRKKPISLCSQASAEKEIAALEKIGAELIAFNEPAYSPLLAKITDAPPLISVLGYKSLMQKKSVAVVGTRDASINGRNMARKLGFELSKADITVVSGLALGIDAAAHEGALNEPSCKGSTIAVLGTGINVPYPQSNQNIYDRIKETGLLVSELPFGTPPQQNNFPRRNRIISGLSVGVVVVEAKKKSGSLITANMALEQGREVYAIPGSPLDARSQGGNHLIKQGAMLIETPADIIDSVKADKTFRLNEDIYTEDFTYIPEKISDLELAEIRSKIISLLGNGPVLQDDLIRTSGASAASVSIVLVELELAGKLERLAGNKINLLAEWE
ncbi:MAG: DNA-processing protein DprA [Alphaproteobacteria bacterium]|nr:DNA-processing protein DprA [Alphaproteobacteria bacterium]